MRGHKSIVSSMDWVIKKRAVLIAHIQHSHFTGQFVLSSSLDKVTAMWTSAGTMVGVFAPSVLNLSQLIMHKSQVNSC